MLRKEWSLIVNSLLVQLAAGIFIFLAVFRLIQAGSLDSETAIRFTAPGIAIVGPLLALSMITSLFHLGNPFRAYRAVTNIGSSWLSREILFTGIFFIFWLVYFFSKKIGISNQSLTWLTILAGILSVISMAGIYYATGKPGWHSLTTYTGFLGSIIILGSISVIVMGLTAGGSASSIISLINISILLLLALLTLRFVQMFAMIYILKPDAETWDMDSLVASSVLKKNHSTIYKTLTLLGLIISISGALLSLVIFRTFGPDVKNTYIIASAVLVFAGEFMGRAGFYSLGNENELNGIMHIPGRDVYGRYINH